MNNRNRWSFLVLIIAGLHSLGCSRTSSASSTFEEPAHLEHIEGTDLYRVVVTEKAAARLDIQMTPVLEKQMVRTRLVGGEIVEAEVRKTGELWVRVPVTDSYLDKVDHSLAALVMLLSGRDEATSMVAQPVEAEAGGTEQGSEALFYELPTAQQAFTPGQRVFVEISMLGSGMKKVIPYQAVMYDLHGETWAYTSPDPLSFVRHPITIDYIDGDMAVLSEGPGVGAQVVTHGVAELWGVESGIGGGHGGH